MISLRRAGVWASCLLMTAVAGCCGPGGDCGDRRKSEAPRAGDGYGAGAAERQNIRTRDAEVERIRRQNDSEKADALSYDRSDAPRGPAPRPSGVRDFPAPAP